MRVFSRLLTSWISWRRSSWKELLFRDGASENRLASSSAIYPASLCNDKKYMVNFARAKRQEHNVKQQLKLEFTSGCCHVLITLVRRLLFGESHPEQEGGSTSPSRILRRKQSLLLRQGFSGTSSSEEMLTGKQAVNRQCLLEYSYPVVIR